MPCGELPGWESDQGACNSFHLFLWKASCLRSESDSKALAAVLPLWLNECNAQQGAGARRSPAPPNPLGPESLQ